jgi:hypothetical protein
VWIWANTRGTAGGGIDFGEAADRPFVASCRKNFGVDLLDVRRLGVLENIFHGFGRDGHDIAFVFDRQRADQTLNERDVVGEVLDGVGTKVMGGR